MGETSWGVLLIRFRFLKPGEQGVQSRDDLPKKKKTTSYRGGGATTGCRVVGRFCGETGGSIFLRLVLAKFVFGGNGLSCFPQDVTRLGKGKTNSRAREVLFLDLEIPTGGDLLASYKTIVKDGADPE